MTDVDDSIQWSVDSMTSSWLTRIKAGDGPAWERLDYAYRRLVLWWCLKSRLPRQDADDIVQDVFLDIRSRITSYQHESFRGWLWTITKRRVADYWRKQSKQPAALGGSTIDEFLNQIQAESSQKIGSVDPESKIIFDAILPFVEREFSPIHWQAFWKVAVEGKKAAEVANELGITRTIVHNSTSRIRRRIREEFGD